MKPILEIDGVHAGYGEVRVLHGASLTVIEGSITALVGSNGAGKTTLLRAVAGLLPVSSGDIRYAGRSVNAINSAARVFQGIALVPEGRILFPAFTVEENLLIGAFSPRIRQRRNDLLSAMYDRYPLLRERRRQAAGTLSGGQQQLVAIARGLMSEPRLLLLDEPSLGLAPQAVDDLFQMIDAIHKTGVTVLLVEQNVRASLALADNAFVLESGHVVLSGVGSQLVDDDRIRQSYLGL
jgi:branched-chain amino acid transport system ATP-binding protein